ncbi:UNVERIFIED_CONTAM: hypothetical protein Sangu_0388000 [Sesamum angustifolium]|uniref:DUF4283 domain-containing protein n=1 Tax=Sesamum angustifolium TaxID=2727405 RepID=A0AAW2QT16_9LAMI
MKMGLKCSYSIGVINYKHIWFWFILEEDFTCIWLRGDWNFGWFPMRDFKWTPNFDARVESLLFALVWIRLPELSVHLFRKNPLFAIASMVKKPLRVDEPTEDVYRPSLARFCIELDLLKLKSIKCIWGLVDTEEEGPLHEALSTMRSPIIDDEVEE